MTRTSSVTATSSRCWSGGSRQARPAGRVASHRDAARRGIVSRCRATRLLGGRGARHRALAHRRLLVSVSVRWRCSSRHDAGARHRLSGALGASLRALDADGVADCGGRAATQRRLRPGPAYARSAAGDSRSGLYAEIHSQSHCGARLDGGTLHQRFRRTARAENEIWPMPPSVTTRGHREPGDPVCGRPSASARSPSVLRQPQPL